MLLLLTLACGKEAATSYPPPAGTGGATADSGDTGGATGGDTDTGDTGTGATVPESCGAVTFTPAAGAPVDYTQAFTDGEYVTLAEDGALHFCTGDWFVRLTVTAAVSVTGDSDDPAHTVLSGGETGTVILVEGAGASVAVSALTLDRGAAFGEGNQRRGGGLRCEAGASVTLRDVVLSNHQAYDAAAMYGSDGCTITAEDVRFVDNRSEDDGGAVRLDASTLTLRRATFSGNRARDCGALFLNESDALIEDSRFEDNTSTDTQGGAVLHYYGDLTVRDSSFVSNQSSGYGGALSLLGDAELSGVSFTDNATTEGGGVYLYPAHGALRCEGCSFSGNTPDDVALEGGGSYTFDGPADFTCDEGGCR